MKCLENYINCKYFWDKTINILLTLLRQLFSFNDLNKKFEHSKNDFININLKYKIPWVDDILKEVVSLVYKFCFVSANQNHTQVAGTKHLSSIFI